MGQHRKKTRNLLRIGLLCIVVVILTALGCSTSSNESQSTRETIGQRSGISVRTVFTRQANVEAALTDVRCVVLRVTGPGISPPISAQQVIPAQTRELTFEVNVPVGNTRVFTVEALAQASACESPESALEFIPGFTGEEVVDIPSTGATVIVRMSLVEGPVVRPLVAPEDVPGQPVDRQIVAADPDGTPLTFSATGLPPGLSIDPTTGRITGTITDTAEREYTVTVTVSNGTDSSSTTFIYVVTNPSPTLTNPGDQTSPESTAVMLQVVATDPDGDPLTFSATGLPPGLSINSATGLITGTLSDTAATGSPYLVTVTVSDSTANTSVAFIWNVTPRLFITDVQVTEGNDGTDTAVFTVSLSAASTLPITVNFATANGTAIAGSDYQATSGTLPFAPGTTTQTLTVPILGDTLDEPNETFTVTLANPTNATLATAQATGTIVDDDVAPTLSISPPVSPVTEGNSGPTPATFTMSLSAASTLPITVNFATANGTAIAGSDYQATSGTLPFAPGTTTQTLTVPILGDTLDEPNETFTVTLANPTNATLATAQATGTIVDDDVAPTLSISPPVSPVTEGNSGPTPATFTISLSAASTLPITVNFATANGTAIAGSDYQATSGTLPFAPGTTTQTLTVPILGDTLDEPNETFTVTLANPTNATLATAQATGTIVDDDVAPTLSISPPVSPVTEGNSGPTPATFTISLSAASTLPITVNFATANGTAIAGSDYQATSGTLPFAPGTTTQTLTVPILGDTLDEPNETFTVTLANPTNATLATAQATGTIVDDDDAPPTLSISPVTVLNNNVASVDIVRSALANEILRYDGHTGAFRGAFVTDDSSTPNVDESGGLATPAGLVFGPDGDLYVSSSTTHQVLRYDGHTGAFRGAFVTDDSSTPNVDESGGLATPAGLVFGPDGDLYVSSSTTHQVLRYDGHTGAFRGAFVTDDPSTPNVDESGGLATPAGLVFGPAGDLYVSSSTTHQVLRYDGHTGAFRGAFVTDDPSTPNVDESGGLATPAGLVFGPDGDLYVSSSTTHQVLRYDGHTGAFRGAFVTDDPSTPNVDESGGLATPAGLVFGPDGDLYVSSSTTHQVLRYDGHTGAFRGAFVTDDPSTPNVDESEELTSLVGVAITPHNIPDTRQGFTEQVEAERK